MKDYWQQLGRTEQFQVALAIARRRGPEWVRHFGNVISVGAGFRLKGEEETIQNQEICICFVVRKKWRDRRRRTQTIPDAVTAYAYVAGKRVRVLVPTDVVETKPGAPHATLDLTDGIWSHFNGKQHFAGSACCLVRNSASAVERYLLTCYHVFSGNLQLPVQDGWECSTDQRNFIGPLTSVATRRGALEIDATLVRINDDDVTDIRAWNTLIDRTATISDLSRLVELNEMYVVARRVAPDTKQSAAVVRSNVLQASFTRLDPGSQFDYSEHGGGLRTFRDTVVYKSAVRPGDSGAALVGSDGTLYGMHFYGSGPYGYALSAPSLFKPGIFALDIEL